MKEIKAPNEVVNDHDFLTIFVAGSIEQGNAEDWQIKVSEFFAECDVLLLNPRRDEWDATLEQKKSNPVFNKQVNWELDNLEDADIILMYLAPNTISPISLLELGLYARSGKLVVACPESFDRHGNVDITCEKYNVPLFSSLDELLEVIKQTYC